MDKIVGKANVTYEGLSPSVRGVDPITTLMVISSFSCASRHCVSISGETLESWSDRQIVLDWRQTCRWPGNHQFNQTYICLVFTALGNIV